MRFQNVTAVLLSAVAFFSCKPARNTEAEYTWCHCFLLEVHQSFDKEFKKTPSAPLPDILQRARKSLSRYKLEPLGRLKLRVCTNREYWSDASEHTEVAVVIVGPVPSLKQNWYLGVRFNGRIVSSNSPLAIANDSVIINLE